MTIKDWPKGEGPRDKLLRQGAKQLSDAELLAVLLRSGLPGQNAVAIARTMISHFGTLRALMTSSQREVCAIDGIGPVKYAQLQAAVEIGTRILKQQLQRGELLTNPELIGDYLSRQLGDRSYEVFAVLLLDSQYRLIEFVELFRGTINSASVYPRDVVALVLQKQAAAVVVCHNHPSGIAQPSDADRAITTRLKQALSTIDVPLLDHLIVGDQQVVSFAKNGWLT